MSAYTRAGTRSLLQSLNIEISYESSTNFFCFCPFHHNTDTPSFTVSHTEGVYLCFNPSCGATGTVLDLITGLSSRNGYEALRYLQAKSAVTDEDLQKELQNLFDNKPDFVEFSQETLNELHSNLLESKEAMSYFDSRKITLEAMKYFELGYSVKQDMVTVPLHAPDGLPVGIIARSIQGKQFKNSVNLPRNKTMFNLHRAKREGGVIIVVESSFDVIRLWQAGYPNAVATLGGSISDDNIKNLNKYSSTIILMTDNDQAGRSLGEKIATRLKNKNVLWSYYNHDKVYPDGAKDVGDMNDEQIKQCIKNAIPHYEYAVL